MDPTRRAVGEHFSRRWRAITEFLGHYFRPWFVRFLAVPTMVISTAYAIDNVLGIAFPGRLFPLSQYLPDGSLPWLLAFGFFVWSIGATEYGIRRVNAEKEKIELLRSEMARQLSAWETNWQNLGHWRVLEAQLKGEARKFEALLAQEQKETSRLRASLESRKAT